MRSLSVLLSSVETSLRTQTAQEIAQEASVGIISIHVCALRIVAAATIRGFILLGAPNCAATIRGYRLIKEIQYLSSHAGGSKSHFHKVGCAQRAAQWVWAATPNVQGV